MDNRPFEQAKEVQELDECRASWLIPYTSNMRSSNVVPGMLRRMVVQGGRDKAERKNREEYTSGELWFLTHGSSRPILGHTRRDLKFFALLRSKYLSYVRQARYNSTDTFLAGSEHWANYGFSRTGKRNTHDCGDGPLDEDRKEAV